MVNRLTLPCRTFLPKTYQTAKSSTLRGKWAHPKARKLLALETFTNFISPYCVFSLLHISLCDLPYRMLFILDEYCLPSLECELRECSDFYFVHQCPKSVSRSQKNSINIYCINKWMNSVGFLCRTNTQHKSSGSRARKMVVKHFSTLVP